MKKTTSLFLVLAVSVAAVFAAPKNANIRDNLDGTVNILNIDKDPSVKYKQKVDDFQDVTVVTGSKIKKLNPITVDLSEFGNQEVYFSFSCDIKVVDKSNNENELIWMINDLDAGMPEIAHAKVPSGEWVTMKGEKALPLGQNKSFYLSGAGLSKENLTIYIKNLQIKLTGDSVSSAKKAAENWADAPSLYQAYKDYFDYFGFACTFKDELRYTEISDVLAKHANMITMGNEFKPDFVFNWQKPSATEDFIAEDGNTYKVPKGMPNYGSMRDILFTAQAMDVQLRGHVLVWHSQTPKWFFKVDYKEENAYVDAATMAAREEWYIKSVLNYVNEWEVRYNKGKHIVAMWDVVNEAVADGAGSQKWLREDSDWYRIFKNEDFIVNAFRYANKYAPKDVLLVYNDYNCYTPGKCAAICNLVDLIRAAPDARIDAIGMQSHIGISYPAVHGNNSFEDTIKKFLAKDVDVQITELDVANGSNKYSSVALKARYKDLFKMFLANRKTDEKHGVMGVTIWGLSDKGTWLNDQAQYKGHKQYPLLMDEEMNVKPAFYGVLEAVESVK